MTKHTTLMLDKLLGNTPNTINSDLKPYTEFIDHGYTARDADRNISPLKSQQQLEFLKYLCISSLTNLLKTQYPTIKLSTQDALDSVKDIPVENWVLTLLKTIE